MRIGYIVHDLNDQSVLRRYDMLREGGAEVHLAGFQRGETLNARMQSLQPLQFGQSEDAAFVKRIGATASQVLTAKLQGLRGQASGDLRHFVRASDVIIARNLEQLAIAVSLIDRQVLVYECLDIHRLLVGHTPLSRLVRAAEARLLPRVDLLLTSSPGFVREHFSKRPLSAPTHIVENKMLGDHVPADRHARTANLPFRVGWFGMLRCRKTLDSLISLAERGQGRVEVIVRGKPSQAEVPDLEERISGQDHITFGGPYRYDELSALYQACHFAWAIDRFEEGLNSDWLLPNRLYEALAFGAVPIIRCGTESARWATAHGIGVIADTDEEAIRTLLSMDIPDVDDHLASVREVAVHDVIADSRDSETLVSAIRHTSASSERAGGNQ